VIDKQRIIQESVPGKQVTLAHVLANPKRDLYSKLGLDSEGRSAIAAIIAADMASKAANVHIEFIDRFSGAVLISGDVSSVEVSLTNVLQGFSELLQFSVVSLTRS
jgi:ethanolamine utilization protein EutS